MKTLLYLSRSFVEFGPFTQAELLDFHQRGLLNDLDYLRVENTDEWVHLQDWVAGAQAVKPAKKAAAPKPEAPAKKAAKKAAVKKAK